ncbi:MAG: tyrosine-type recombinase/integrase [Thaumarchaeota archaeon]|nr:tyrosine-type recombinase/integrase [Nitrososphaerota archaeon]MCL5317224.1 tyrosine-type recombinase/integrase [Nitrososphaerota archaeon]
MPDKKGIWSIEVFLKVNGWTSEYESVQRFLNHLKRKSQSESSRLVFCEILSKFCRHIETDPDKLVSMSKDEIEETVHGYLDWLKSSGISLKRIKNDRAFLISFFRENGFKHDKELEIDVYHVPARYRKKPEYIPSKEEVFAMAGSAGGLKNRAIILCLFSSGLRNATFRALLYTDVKRDVESDKDTIMVPVYPEMKNRIARSCKNNIPYYTFFSPQATEALRTYLNERKKNNRKIEDDEYLFPPDDRRVPLEQRVRSSPSRTLVQTVVKNSARRCGKIEHWQDVYPHALRKSFESILRSPGGGMDIKTQEFLMGHLLPGSQDPYFGSGVRVQGSSISFDERCVEQIREQYTKLPWGLAPSNDQVRKQAAKDQLKILEALNVLPKEQIETISELLDEKSVDEIDWPTLFEKMRKHDQGTQAPILQKAVTSENAEKLVEQGWRYVGTLPNGKVIMEGSTPAVAEASEAVHHHPPPPRNNPHYF